MLIMVNVHGIYIKRKLTNYFEVKILVVTFVSKISKTRVQKGDKIKDDI